MRFCKALFKCFAKNALVLAQASCAASLLYRWPEGFAKAWLASS